MEVDWLIPDLLTTECDKWASRRAQMMAGSWNIDAQSNPGQAIIENSHNSYCRDF